MNQRDLKKLIQNNRLGNSYACIEDKVFENRDGDVMYIGKISKKNKKYYIEHAPAMLFFKNKSETLFPYQILATEIKSYINAFLNNKITFEELKNQRIYFKN